MGTSFGVQEIRSNLVGNVQGFSRGNSQFKIPIQLTYERSGEQPYRFVWVSVIACRFGYWAFAQVGFSVLISQDGLVTLWYIIVPTHAATEPEADAILIDHSHGQADSKHCSH